MKKYWSIAISFGTATAAAVLVFLTTDVAVLRGISVLMGFSMTLWCTFQARRRDVREREVAGYLTSVKGDSTSVDHHDVINSLKANRAKDEMVVATLNAIGRGEQTFSMSDTLREDKVGQAIENLQTDLTEIRAREKRQHWLSEGLAKFSVIFREKGELSAFMNKILSELVRYVGANQGALFIEQRDDEDERYLELIACYAYDKRRFVERRISPGEGLLGQCMYEKDVIFMTVVPDSYVKITSGLGLATPRNLVIIPLLDDDIFYGAIELASFNVLQSWEIDFLKQTAEGVASEIKAIKTLEHTRRLLNESDILSQKLLASEEELKQNLEELAATQEEMSRKQNELLTKQIELDGFLSAIDNTVGSVEFDSAGVILQANDVFTRVTGFKKSHLNGQHYSCLFHNDDSMKMMWSNLQAGQFFSGEYRITDHNGKEQWINGTLNPMVDSNRKVYKVLLLAQFITQEKERLNDLSAMVSILKNVLPVIEFNADFSGKSANEKFLKIFNISRINLKKTSLSSLIDRACYSQTVLPFLTANEGKMEIQGALPLLVDGELTTCEVSLSLLKNPSGQLQRVVMVVLKITGLGEKMRVAI